MPPKKKRNEKHFFPVPEPGLAFDIEGPSAENLIDTSEIYNQVVYKDVHALLEEWEVVTESEAAPYFPTRTQPVNVNIGIDKKESVEIPLFGFVKLEDHFKYKKGYILNTGGNTWGLDFVPKVESEETDPHDQYLAVGGYRGASEEHMGLDELQPTGSYKNTIQIWKMKLSAKQTQTDPILDICILHDFGVIYDLQWCPYGAYEQKSTRSKKNLPKLGIVSVAFGDGTLRTMVVPHPEAIRKTLNLKDKTIYLRVKKSRCTFTTKFSNALSVSWGGHKMLASTGAGGDVSVWNMEKALIQPSEFGGEHLIYCAMVLDSAGKTICWRGKKDPFHIIVGGFDGQIRLIDLNDPQVPLTMNRSRGPVCAIAWPGHTHMLMSSGCEDMLRGITYSGSMANCYLKYGELPGPVWDINASEHHGQMAIVNSTGWNITCSIYQPKIKSVASLKTNDYTEKQPRYEIFGTPEVAIQKAIWNPNKKTAGFLATSGSSGLCRIDYEGKGTKWD